MPLPEISPLSVTQRVLRQLVEALIFERYVDATYSALPEHSGTFGWTLARTHYSVKGRVTGFGRVRVDITTLTINRYMCRDFSTALIELINELPSPNEIKHSLLEELSQTVRLCDWNSLNLPRKLSRRICQYAELDGLLDEGHPYHPSFKARTAFSLTDHQSYGPESAARFQLEWLAVKLTHLQMALPSVHDVFWLHELGLESWRQLTTQLSHYGVSWDEYALLPVHPWQYQQLKATWLERQESLLVVIPLGVTGDHYSATQSVRTLMNVSQAAKAHVKLPMNMVNTSSKRTLEPYSVCRAPEISTWLSAVTSNDPSLSGLSVLEEFAAAIFKPPECPLHTEPADGQLALIMRQSVESVLAAGEQAIPFNALMMVEHDGMPFISGWVEQFGLKRWLTRLLQVVVIPVWHLLVKHGIALEAHGQNMVLVVADGWPTRLIVRDFHESVEFTDSFLADKEHLPTFLADGHDNYYRAESIELLRELVMDTLFVYNLTEIAHLLMTHYEFCDADFWQEVMDCLHGYQIEHPELSERLAMLGHDQPYVLTESLLTRKLIAAKDECHHLIPNPLSFEKDRTEGSYDLHQR
ncbi:IucA/IucC family protein [Photobacterium minamisatsumaniensis]|uniref:IucA/IucC family protein n=1 Tax=Photobacterium minamisatsumaniensis TaxID=2910233 RepID=UPI003D0ACC25